MTRILATTQITGMTDGDGQTDMLCAQCSHARNCEPYCA